MQKGRAEWCIYAVNDSGSRARGWIRKDTKIGPFLNIHVYHHEDRYSIEIQVRSLFQDRTASWVRIVDGVEKYVNETTETIQDEEHRALGKPVAKARPRMKFNNIADTRLRSSSHHECYVISKSNDQIASTRSEYSSGNRRSSEV